MASPLSQALVLASDELDFWRRAAARPPPAFGPAAAAEGLRALAARCRELRRGRAPGVEARLLERLEGWALEDAARFERDASALVPTPAPVLAPAPAPLASALAPFPSEVAPGVFDVAALEAESYSALGPSRGSGAGSGFAEVPRSALGGAGSPLGLPPAPSPIRLRGGRAPHGAAKKRPTASGDWASGARVPLPKRR